MPGRDPSGRPIDAFGSRRPARTGGVRCMPGNRMTGRGTDAGQNPCPAPRDIAAL